ncbi:MAG: helix-turn-helix domain-containing protein [Roseibium sp.]
MPLLQQNDVLFAHKALNVVPGLSAASRRVAGAIIDHFNKKTGQCDPSIGRIMKLLKISRAAVIRATNELDVLGLIEKKSHGGKSHRTAYLPNWSKFRTFVEDWDNGMKSGEGPTGKLETVSDLRPSQSQSCDMKGLKNETQTLRKNSLKKPVGTDRDETLTAQIDELNKSIDTMELLKRTDPQGQRSFLLPIQGGHTQSRSEVALNKAQQRWEDDLMQLSREKTEAIVEWLNIERMEQATEAEMAESGGGLDLIIRKMKSRLISA